MGAAATSSAGTTLDAVGAAVAEPPSSAVGRTLGAVGAAAAAAFDGAKSSAGIALDAVGAAAALAGAEVAGAAVAGAASAGAAVDASNASISATALSYFSTNLTTSGAMLPAFSSISNFWLSSNPMKLFFCSTWDAWLMLTKQTNPILATFICLYNLYL